ncbi:MAG: ATP-dependent DNA helicase RecG [Deltaproteobacteria bacterium]|nr:ATP-dependent DNA helicase RecG [Deltaproteobacteria bacterium]
MAGKKNHNTNPLQGIQTLTDPLIRLKGVGPQKSACFAHKGIHTLADLFFFTPVRYEDRTRITPIREIKNGERSLIRGQVIYGNEERFFRSRKRIYRIIVRDATGSLELIWFRYIKGHLERFTRQGTECLVYGTGTHNRGHIQMIHPDITVSGQDKLDDRLDFYPVYSSIQGISDHFLRSLIRISCDGYLHRIIDPVPEELLGGLDLPTLQQAIHNVHFPPKTSSISALNRFDTKWHKRLVFDRFFSVMLALTVTRQSREDTVSPPYALPRCELKDMEAFFPFPLTSHQHQAVEEIKKDFLAGRPMKRLLMGDVGSGKTVVAALAAYMAILNKKQVALMTPTQILAKQHLEYLSGLPETMGLRPVLLSGAQKKKTRDDIYGEIRDGAYNLIIGTHALIQEKLAFADLGLVVIDEQHRFGVRQRALMQEKGDTPHVLVMTATPIPRTLAIAIYGDMDISMIKEYPKGHVPVETHIIGVKQKKWAFDVLREKLSAGQQAFIICPVIEGSEEMDLKSAQEMASRFKKVLSPPFRIGLVHGRQLSEEREMVMNAFHKGRIHVLVGTTIIEVGVHVPNATVMIIEHAERFGLAQLHQLRGRVGRGSEKGICLLIESDNAPSAGRSRLETLVKCHDGFEIAQKDLEFRGHGEIMGMRQAGLGELDLTEVMREQDLFLRAKREAQRLIILDPKLIKPENALLKNMVKMMLERSLDL